MSTHVQPQWLREVLNHIDNSHLHSARLSQEVTNLRSLSVSGGKVVIHDVMNVLLISYFTDFVKAENYPGLKILVGKVAKAHEDCAKQIRGWDTELARYNADKATNSNAELNRNLDFRVSFDLPSLDRASSNARDQLSKTELKERKKANSQEASMEAATAALTWASHRHIENPTAIINVLKEMVRATRTRSDADCYLQILGIIADVLNPVPQKAAA